MRTTMRGMMAGAAPRRALLAGALSASALALPRRAAAQAAPVRLVVPFTPGGSNDVIARLIADRVGAAWGQPFVVENRAGASGNIGAEAVARAAPDGQTWLLAANQILTTNPHLLRANFDPARDLALVARLARVEMILVTHPAFLAATLREVVELARRERGRFSYASVGAGSLQHLAMAQLVGEDMVHVPYGGAAALMPDLLAGRVQAYVGALNTLLPHLRAGTLRAIAGSAELRGRTLPELPTFAEAGFPGRAAEIWLGLAVPAATPGPAVARIHGAVAEALQEAEAVRRLGEQAIEVALLGPAEVTRAVAEERARLGALIARLNLAPA